jgi:hypothetical protein
MSGGGQPVRFHPEGEDRWIARTANDAYFVVDGRAKEVIEVLAACPSANVAWDTYVGRASALRKVNREDFEGIAARITRQGAPAQARHMRIRAMTRVLSPDMALRLAARVVFLFPARSTRPAIAALVVALALSFLPTPSAATEAMARHAGAIATLMLVLAGVFLHELGHAAALRKAGEAPGGVSFGVRYFVYPCFFTDVSSAWLLPRRQRILVNLGGCYLQALFAALLWSLSLVCGDTVAAPLAEASRTSAFLCMVQLVPFPGSDGHWIFRDLASVHLDGRTPAGRLLAASGWVALALLAIQACAAALRFGGMLSAAWSSGAMPADIASWRNFCALLLIVSFGRVLPSVFVKLHGYAAHPCKRIFARGQQGD